MNNSQTTPRVHHVVIAVHPESFDDATDYLQGLGFALQDFEVEDVGLRLRIDWAGGIELVTPTAGHVAEAGSVGDFLATFGQGVFTVVVRVVDADRAGSTAVSLGAAERYRQHRTGDGYELAEVEMSPRHGVPITFLETDLD